MLPTTQPSTTHPTSTTTLPTTHPTSEPRILVGPGGIQTTSPSDLIDGSSTAASGIFGVGSNLDPLIIFALVIAGLLFLIIVAVFIYCCCAYCGVPTRQDLINRTPSNQSIRPFPTIQSIRPEASVYVTSANIAPDGPYSVKVHRPTVRKKYLYPADDMDDDVTFNSIRSPGGAPIITTLGNGYAVGHSFRSSGNNYNGRGSFFIYE